MLNTRQKNTSELVQVLLSFFCGALSESIGSTSTNLHYCANNTTTNYYYYHTQTNINKCMQTLRITTYLYNTKTYLLDCNI